MPSMRDRRRRFQRYLRQHQHLIPAVQTAAFTIIGVLAVAWLLLDAGWLEPVTLILSLFTSIAAVWVQRLAPPIAQLTNAGLRELIAYSDPHHDWERVHIRGSNTMAYRWDNDLTIVDPHHTDREDFQEPWIPAIWNGVASFTVTVRKAGQPAFELPLLSIDGGRSVLPYPRGPSSLRITRLQDTVARIVKEIDEQYYPYDLYLRQSSITVVDSFATSASQAS